METKTTDINIDNSLLLISTAFNLYEEDNKLINFDCPICGHEVQASLIMYGDSLHGVIECKNCDTFIRI
ncbi:hypothetical protein [Clostridium tunisiense]|uniref:hypothetical protein n=1 Tax=Clostridium tunisiense TaxID=219748 RepID=UPI000305FE4C|nr:hypothetical protein [Clostridium tunisiense]